MSLTTNAAQLMQAATQAAVAPHDIALDYKRTAIAEMQTVNQRRQLDQRQQAFDYKVKRDKQVNELNAYKAQTERVQLLQDDQDKRVDTFLNILGKQLNFAAEDPETETRNWLSPDDNGRQGIDEYSAKAMRMTSLLYRNSNSMIRDVARNPENLARAQRQIAETPGLDQETRANALRKLNEVGVASMRNNAGNQAGDYSVPNIVDTTDRSPLGVEQYFAQTFGEKYEDVGSQMSDWMRDTKVKVQPNQDKVRKWAKQMLSGDMGDVTKVAAQIAQKQGLSEDTDFDGLSERKKQEVASNAVAIGQAAQMASEYRDKATFMIFDGAMDGLEGQSREMIEDIAMTISSELDYRGINKQSSAHKITGVLDSIQGRIQTVTQQPVTLQAMHDNPADFKQGVVYYLESHLADRLRKGMPPEQRDLFYKAARDYLQGGNGDFESWDDMFRNTQKYMAETIKKVDQWKDLNGREIKQHSYDNMPITEKAMSKFNITDSKTGKEVSYNANTPMQQTLNSMSGGGLSMQEISTLLSPEIAGGGQVRIGTSTEEDIPKKGQENLWGYYEPDSRIPKFLRGTTGGLAAGAAVKVDNWLSGDDKDDVEVTEEMRTQAEEIIEMQGIALDFESWVMQEEASINGKDGQAQLSMSLDEMVVPGSTLMMLRNKPGFGLDRSSIPGPNGLGDVKFWKVDYKQGTDKSFHTRGPDGGNLLHRIGKTYERINESDSPAKEISELNELAKYAMRKGDKKLTGYAMSRMDKLGFEARNYLELAVKNEHDKNLLERIEDSPNYESTRKKLEKQIEERKGKMSVQDVWQSLVRDHDVMQNGMVRDFNGKMIMAGNKTIREDEVVEEELQSWEMLYDLPEQNSPVEGISNQELSDVRKALNASLKGIGKKSNVGLIKNIDKTLQTLVAAREQGPMMYPIYSGEASWMDNLPDAINPQGLIPPLQQAGQNISRAAANISEVVQFFGVATADTISRTIGAGAMDYNAEETELIDVPVGRGGREALAGGRKATAKRSFSVNADRDAFETFSGWYKDSNMRSATPERKRKYNALKSVMTKALFSDRERKEALTGTSRFIEELPLLERDLTPDDVELEPLYDPESNEIVFNVYVLSRDDR